MNNKLALELIWWLVTLIVVILFILPIYNVDLLKAYPYYIPNIIFIVIFLTLARYIFLLKHTFIAHSKLLKLVLIFLPIPLLLYSFDNIYNFMDFYDKDGFVNILTHLGPEKAMDMVKYIRYQFVFFATSSIIVLFLFPIRMIISIWRSINRGSV